MKRSETQPLKKRWWRRRWFKIAASLAVVSLLVFVGALEYVIHNAAPILRKRVIQTLSARFDAPVELDSLDISLVKGVEVSGKGLRIPYNGQLDTALPGPSHVLLKIDQFRFHSSVKALLHSPTHINTVYVDGMVLDLPPGPQRGHILGSNEKAAPADPSDPRTNSKITIVADVIRCTNSKLIIENGHVDKEPREFDMSSVVLREVAAGQPLQYDANIVNPVPKGDIHAEGHFGPWQSEEPRDTALDGKYTFSHADLNTIKGLGGILSSVGTFNGVLDHITVDGTTDTPDFSLDISGHAVPLKTTFHAYVDGMTGDTTLDPVDAQLAHSHLICRGKVMNLKHRGHDTTLDVVMPQGRIEDVLELGTKSRPVMMRGSLTMRTKLHVPPGKQRVANKLELAGSVHIGGVTFSNPKFQEKIDSLSARAQGHPKDNRDENEAQKAAAPSVRSEIATTFTLGHGQVTLPTIRYAIPGAVVTLDGLYIMDSDMYEFKGHVQTEAKASQMVSGWKSWLLKPVDPFFSKHGAGLEVPISISGQGKDIHFGLAFHHADDSISEMKDDLKEKRIENAQAGGNKKKK